MEYLYMRGSSLKSIPCSLIKSFPRLRWWDLRYTYQQPQNCRALSILNIWFTDNRIIQLMSSTSLWNPKTLNIWFRDNRIINLPPALAYHPCLEACTLLLIMSLNQKLWKYIRNSSYKSQCAQWRLVKRLSLICTYFISSVQRVQHTSKLEKV